MDEIFDHRRCELGEGALWHPERQALFWFDILAGRLLTPGRDWVLGEAASAAGWIDRDTLLVATESGLWRLALESGARDPLAPLPGRAPHLRSNDGRADPCGGFWIGTMGKGAEPKAGAIHRYYQGEMREIRAAVTIPNAICFDAAREIAFFADTAEAKIWTLALGPQGWPVGEPRLFLDLSADGLWPDGAVIDAAGDLWVAQWGAGRVACHDGRDGRFLGAEAFPARQLTCPAFGGPDYDILHVTSAFQGLDAAARQADPAAGQTFCRRVPARGVPEPPVRL